MTITVRISQPAKTAMQSGRAKTDTWLLEALPQSRRTPEPIMGWNSARDTLAQIRLTFPSCEEAVAHAEKNGWHYSITQPHSRLIKPKNYASNFID